MWQAAVALLRFILTHAAKYSVERTDLVEELLQLGMQRAVAEVIALSYEQLRPRIQDQLHAQRFRVHASIIVSASGVQS